MGLEFEKGNAQEGSLFFTKLPPELRRKIFIYLFGNSTVHIKFRQSKEQFKREGHPTSSKIPGWCHCICRKAQRPLPHRHSEANHKWHYLSANIMFTCKWAYQSGLHVLYGTNELMLDNVKDFAMFISWVNTNQKYIPSLNLCLDSTCTVDLHANICQLSIALSHTSLLKGLEVRIYLPHLTADGDDDDDVNELRKIKDSVLMGIKGFVYALNESTVSTLDLYLQREMEEVMEADKRCDGETWQKVDCEYGENVTVDFVGDGPESDDENHGLYVFPTQGDF
ncbi:hypothetical protein IL306_008030 [Fusarium sp. DS 682]|nr:hypothetical protein IL306_008030 [Fusarium sp. DS 682]